MRMSITEDTTSMPTTRLKEGLTILSTMKATTQCLTRTQSLIQPTTMHTQEESSDSILLA